MKNILTTVTWTVLTGTALFVLWQGTRLMLLLLRDVEGYKKYWLTQAEKPGTSSDLIYIALGDSLAQGLGATQPQNGYVGLLASRLSTQTNTPVRVINLSVSGAKIQDVIHDQLPQLRELKVNTRSVVTLDIGANDLPEFDAERFRAQMDDLLKQLPPQTVVADLPYFGGGRARSREPDAKAGSAIIRDLAARYDLLVAPVHDLTMQHDSIWVYGADFFHPSNRGYRNWYEAFRQVMDL